MIQLLSLFLRPYFFFLNSLPYVNMASFLFPFRLFSWATLLVVENVDSKVVRLAFCVAPSYWHILTVVHHHVTCMIIWSQGYMTTNLSRQIYQSCWAFLIREWLHKEAVNHYQNILQYDTPSGENSVIYMRHKMYLLRFWIITYFASMWILCFLYPLLCSWRRT